MNIDNFLIKNVHIVPGSTVILGISGGPDSMALLSLMQEFTKKVSLKLVVAHVNHNVRKESDNELLMVKKYCEDNNIISDLGRYFTNKDGVYDEFRTICSRIKRNIRQDQLDGGFTGIYNPSITQRLNNITEKFSERS